MTDQAKLRVAELKVLKREEEAVRAMLSQYRNSLNALKVEELTVFKLLGTSRDRDRLSRNSTPLTGVLPPSKSRSQSTESVQASVPLDPVSINTSSLNLSAAPLIHRMLEDQTAYDDEEDEHE